MNFKVKVHQPMTQTYFNSLQCYGRRVKIPKKFIISIYTFLAVIIPVVVPLPFLYFLNKYIPESVRYE